MVEVISSSVNLRTTLFSQILSEAGLCDLKEALTEYVAGEILTTASQLQSKGGSTDAVCDQQEIDNFGNELIKCVSVLSKTEV